MATKSLKDLDHLQSSIKCIVEDAFKQVDILKENLEISQKNCDNLTKKNQDLADALAAIKSKDTANSPIANYIQVLHEFEEYKRKVNSLCCSQCLRNLGSNYDELIRKELDDISSLELDTQFEADSPMSTRTSIVQETPSPSFLFKNKTPTKTHVAKNLMKTIFGVTSPNGDDAILVDNSPVRMPSVTTETLCSYVPETMEQYEKTPIKLEVVDETLIRLTPNDRMLKFKKPRMDGSKCVSPLLFSPVKASPKKNSPKGTPSKRFLKKSHRITPEITQQGVRKLSQTRLDMEFYRKFRAPENLDPSSSSRSPEKKESLPLNSVENNIDLDETKLTASAVRGLCDNDGDEKEAKEIFVSSYDRIPDDDNAETRKECRKKLPGLECQDCVKWYNHWDNADESKRRKLLDKFSRHRTKHVPLPNTPEGYWKPMLSPSQRD